MGSIRASPKLIPEVGSPPGFAIAYSLFDTSSAVRLRSPLSTVPAGIIVPAFPQRSPPLLLTTAACGGLRSAPDRRPRRALLHLPYSYAPPYSDSARDTRPFPTCGFENCCCAKSSMSAWSCARALDSFTNWQVPYAQVIGLAGCRVARRMEDAVFRASAILNLQTTVVAPASMRYRAP